jgi:hypothetical protein
MSWGGADSEGEAIRTFRLLNGAYMRTIHNSDGIFSEEVPPEEVDVYEWAWPSWVPGQSRSQARTNRTESD